MAAANAIGSFCLVFIFGELAILVSELNVRDAILQKKMTTAKTAMSAIGMPMSEQNKI